MSGRRSDRFWARYALLYDLAWDNTLTTQLGRQVVASIPDRSRPSRVLEIGCGTGLITQWLAAAGHDVTAIDTSQAMRKRASSRVPGARLEAWDARRLPDTARGYDAIVAANVVQFLPDAPAVCEDWVRRLRPGGVLVVTQPQPNLTQRHAIRAMVRHAGARATSDAGALFLAHIGLALLRATTPGPGMRYVDLGPFEPAAHGTQRLTTRRAPRPGPSTLLTE